MSGTARRAMVIAYDFPPHGAIGTMRTLRLVRQLHQEGWQVTVLTGAPETYVPGTPIERGTEARVPAGVEVLQVRAIRPYVALENLVRRLRGGRARATGDKAAPAPNGESRGPARPQAGWKRRLIGVRDSIEALLDMPDKESGWILPALVRGLAHMLRHGRPDVVYSSAPPWSGQVIALALVTLSRRPWIADFRDPWARAPWRDWQLALRRRVVAWLERRVVTTAEAVLFVTQGNRFDFVEVYGPEAARRFHLVPNGCDPTELEALEPLPRREPFVLLHAGSFYGPRSPMPVIHAIARAVERGVLSRERFRLRLLGTITLAVDVPAECARLGIAELVEFVPRVTRAESLAEMKSASALLLVQIATTVSVPAKAYEYLAAGRPILALAEESDTASLVRGSGAGVSVRPDASLEEIERALQDVMALAGSFRPVDPSHYDGRLHAATTTQMLDTVARRAELPLADTGAASVVAVSSQEPRA
jgi:hypothetical protein